MKRYTTWKVVDELTEIGNCTNFTDAVVNFIADGYNPMTKRKTVTESDRKALEYLKEMVTELEKRMEG